MFHSKQKQKDNSKSIVGMFREFGVNTEEELTSLLSKEIDTLPCVYCGEEISIDLIKFHNGDPICLRCKGG
jgi:formylmethanofuran dehydrogenase subunit E